MSIFSKIIRKKEDGVFLCLIETDNIGILVGLFKGFSPWKTFIFESQLRVIVIHFCFLRFAYHEFRSEQ